MMRRLRAARSDERGFTMATVMGAMLVISLATAGAFAATTGDIRAGTDDVQRKQAYAAAEAGIQAYAYELGRDPDVYIQCTQARSITVNQRVAPGAARTWTAVPNATSQFAIEILPAPGRSSCVVDDESSIIDPSTGTFRIRVTGRANPTTKVKRSLIATFRKPSFANYVYFTDDEGSNIRFVTGDNVNGPLHTNDDIIVCGQPRFGTAPSDPIEIVGEGSTGDGWTPDGGCAGSRPIANNVPNVAAPPSPSTVGTWVHPTQTLEMPASNTELQSLTLSGYRFRGETWINFNGTTMTVTGTREDGVVYSNTTLPMPPNGLIFVSNVNCSGPYNPSNPYNSAVNGADRCGTAWIQGSYAKSVTVAAQADIVVTGNLTRSGNVVAGLISNNFIRVYHPIVGGNSSCSSGSSNASSPPAAHNKAGHPLSLPLHNVQIQAAILSLQRSFTVDSYMCGARLTGALNVTGAIAQKTRGAVGTSANTGYLKNYVYDTRLRYRTPPFFLDPVRSSWRLASQQEQVPAQ